MGVSWDKWLSEQAVRAADRWYRVQVCNLFERYYLWFRPYSCGGGLDVAVDRPGPEWELAWPERIPPSWTREYVVQWIREKARRLPCLPPELV